MNSLLTSSAQPVSAPNTLKYYLTQETPALLRRLVSSGEKDERDPSIIVRRIEEISSAYKDSLLTLIVESLPETEVIFHSEEEINGRLVEMVRQELERDPSLCVVCLDRFLLTDAEFRVERFEITRLSNDTKDARPGSPSIESQLDSVAAAVGERKVLLVDDGLFSGGSIRDAMSLMMERGITIEKVLAFVRDPSQAPRSLENAPIMACVEMEDLKDWIDLRDFLTLCGRTHPKDDSLPYYTTQYYLAPSDDGRKASLDSLPLKQFLEFSRRALSAEDDMLGAVESTILQRALSVRDVVRAGFAISHFPSIDLPPEDEEYRRYILKARKIVDAKLLPNPDCIVFDMDGTFYSLDGLNGGFAGSTLEQAIEEGALSFVMEKEGCDRNRAAELFGQAKKDPVGASSFFARRYSEGREAYFDATWGKVDVETIVRPDPSSKELIDALRAKTQDFVLVTSAPRVWMEKVMKRLGINPMEYFPRIFTAEDFSAKSDVFSTIAAENGEKVTFSVGDTPASDIAPAEEVGMIGFLVDASNPLANLVHAGTLKDA